jgi:hypothetical protein
MEDRLAANRGWCCRLLKCCVDNVALQRALHDAAKPRRGKGKGMLCVKKWRKRTSAKSILFGAHGTPPPRSRNQGPKIEYKEQLPKTGCKPGNDAPVLAARAE